MLQYLFGLSAFSWAMRTYTGWSPTKKAKGMRLVAMLIVHDVLHNWVVLRLTVRHMEISHALSLLHIQASVRPAVGRDRLLGCIRAVTFHVRASKGKNNAPLRWGSELEENVGIERVGGSPRWLVLCGVTACISDAFSVSACDTILASLVRACSSWTFAS